MLTPEQISDAREWLAQLTWGNIEAEDCLDAELVSDAETVLNLEKFYDGGWPQFLTDRIPV